MVPDWNKGLQVLACPESAGPAFFEAHLELPSGINGRMSTYFDKKVKVRAASSGESMTRKNATLRLSGTTAMRQGATWLALP